MEREKTEGAEAECVLAATGGCAACTKASTAMLPATTAGAWETRHRVQTPPGAESETFWTVPEPFAGSGAQRCKACREEAPAINRHRTSPIALKEPVPAWSFLLNCND